MPPPGTAPGAPGPADPSGTGVLLVEDDEGDAFLVQELLLEASAQVEIRWVRSVSAALEALEAGRGSYDCVLLDLGLPDAEGLVALRRVLERVPEAAVLVLTGLADEHRGAEAVAAGAQDYLVKGQVDGQLLARSIRYALERKRAEEQLRRLYATELRAAENARLERGLLPKPLLRDRRLEVEPRYRPGRGAVLGGDFYDVVETEDGTLLVLLGDVAGHGPDEAALGVCLRIAWRALVLAGIERDRLLPCLEDVLVQERASEEVFATLCLLVVAPDRRSARIVLAGHPAPLLLGAEPVQLPDDLVGPALGVLPGVVWGSRTVQLEGAWRVMAFSDGLVEGHVDGGPDRLGVDGLLDLVRASDVYDRSGPLADELIQRAQDLHGGELDDDVAVVVVGFGPAA
ncbi:response regulator [Vallicoccus soli]|uniref:Response regulator n=1 Tax=Vallicoccus soli TaxID=2339232 RepID=A0A3A3ZIY7_9ACTN|nr:response regulator [Vallicoccus soli]